MRNPIPKIIFHGQTLWQKIKSTKAKYGAFFILGSLFVFAFPPYNYFVFSFFSIIFSSLLLRSAFSIKDLFISLVAFSGGICIFGLYWIYFSSEYVFGSGLLSLLVFVGFIFLYSTTLIPTWILIYLYRESSWKMFIIITIIAWSAYEVVKLYYFGGFPWFVMAQIWDFNLSILQIVSVVGVLGLSLLTVIFVCSFFILFDFSQTLMRKLIFISVMPLLFLGFYIFGNLRIKHESNDSKIQISVRIVQTTISQDEKLTYSRALPIFHDTLELAFSNIDNANPPKYIILPEVAFSFVLEDYPELFNELKSKIPAESTLLMGALRREGNNFYNSLYAISGKSKEVIYSYDKVRLVPFGEYIPFAEALPFIESFTGLSGLKSGSGQSVFRDSLSGGDQEITVIPLICFEGVFPIDSKHISNESWILNISNEAWFNDSNEIEQNVSMFRLITLESGIIGLKVANRGMSAIVNAKGEFVYKSNNQTSIIKDTYLTIDKKNKIYNSIVSAILYMVVLLGYILTVLIFLLKKVRLIQ